MTERSRTWFWVLAILLVLTAAIPGEAAWEPTRPIELVVPAGTGGGADQMARLIAGIAEKPPSPDSFIGRSILV